MYTPDILHLRNLVSALWWTDNVKGNVFHLRPSSVILVQQNFVYFLIDKKTNSVIC